MYKTGILNDTNNDDKNGCQKGKDTWKTKKLHTVDKEKLKALFDTDPIKGIYIPKQTPEWCKHFNDTKMRYIGTEHEFDPNFVLQPDTFEGAKLMYINGYAVQDFQGPRGFNANDARFYLRHLGGQVELEQIKYGNRGNSVWGEKTVYNNLVDPRDTDFAFNILKDKLPEFCTITNNYSRFDGNNDRTRFFHRARSSEPKKAYYECTFTLTALQRNYIQLKEFIKEGTSNSARKVCFTRVELDIKGFNEMRAEKDRVAAEIVAKLAAAKELIDLTTENSILTTENSILTKEHKDLKDQHNKVAARLTHCNKVLTGQKRTANSAGFVGFGRNKRHKP
jgi:hypothetical protein